MIFIFIFILSFSQIWLNLLVNCHHFGYNIKLTPPRQKKKRKEKTTACISNMSAVRQLTPVCSLLKQGKILTNGVKACKQSGEFNVGYHRRSKKVSKILVVFTLELAHIFPNFLNDQFKVQYSLIEALNFQLTKALNFSICNTCRVQRSVMT